MAGLVPAIHDFDRFQKKDVDARPSARFTPVFDGLSPAMTEF
jgi:hypothetical protein